MKKIVLLLAVLSGLYSFGQEPQTVYSITKEIHELSWYQTQSDLWKKEIDKNNKNANAWYNYYSAERALKNLSPFDSEERKKHEENCEKIANEAYQLIPNSFEANHLMWWQGFNDQSKVKYLEKAFEINPNDPRTFDDLMIQAELKRERANFNFYANKIFLANEYPAGMYNWGYNLLSELDQGAILLTGGDNDTYSVWINQAVNQYRTDVVVINTSLILIDEYRKKLFAELGIEFNQSFSDIKTQEGHEKFKKELFGAIFNQQKRPVYHAVTVRNLEQFYGKMFLTGLAYKYSEIELDNVSIIRRNYERKYLLDYLKINFSFNPGNKIAENLNQTYLPAFIKLYKHYKATEEYPKMVDLENFIIILAQNSGKESEIAELLGPAETNGTTNYNAILLNTKAIEKNMEEVKSKLFFGKYEVTNAEYNKFLNNVLLSRELDLFKSCVYDSIKWHEKFPGGYITPMLENYHWHPAYLEYPIVNISYDAANKYCEWLTQQYNRQSKRKYQKVRFRLPTEEEWKFAAGNGNINAKTGFENDQVQNEKQCYLANIKTGPDRFYDDGGFFQVKVDSYLPNDFGLFNMIGNVSEMTQTKGQSKGGNWFLEMKDCTIDKEFKYDGPDPRVGFRIVMEIIEE